MSSPCDVCKSSIVKDSVLCKVCTLAVAHPSCAAKSRKGQSSQFWTCRACRAETNSTGSGADLQGAGVSDQIAALEATLLAAIEANSADITKKLATIETKVSDIETALNFLSTKYDELSTLAQEQKGQIVELRKDLEGVHLKIKQRDATVTELQLKLDQLEQAGLAFNLELHGVPEIPNKSLDVTLQELAAKVGAPPPANTLADAYRLPSRPSKAQGQRPLPGVVVLKFKEASARDAWLKGRAQLLPPRTQRTGGGVAAPPQTAAEVTAGGANLDGPRHTGPPPVRVYEQLTPRNKRLLFLAREAASKQGFNFVWVRGGKIFVRKAEKQALIRIFTEEDIVRKMGNTLPPNSDANK
jgi:hypothetical protein